MENYVGKLKTIKELSEITPSIPSKVILNAECLAGLLGLLNLKPTASANVWVLGSGYTLPIEAFEWVIEGEPVEESIVLPKGSIVETTEDVVVTRHIPCKLVPETPEEVLSIDHSLSIPETPKEPSEALEPLKMTNSLFSKNSDFKHRTHYIKLVLKDPNLSFRYFFQSEDNKHQENAWWLKDHDNKQSISVNKAFIRKHYEDIIDMFEVIGRYYPKKGYLKIVKNLRTNQIVEIKE